MTSCWTEYYLHLLNTHPSVGRYIDSTIETINDLELLIILMFFFLKYRQFSIVFNSVNDREHTTDFNFFILIYYHFFQFLDFFKTIFPKKAVFSKKNLKNCFESPVDYFLGKGGPLTPKINVTIFIANQVLNILLFNSFSKKKKKKLYFRRKWRKTVSGGQVPLEEKGASDNENEYNLFYGK